MYTPDPHSSQEVSQTSSPTLYQRVLESDILWLLTQFLPPNTYRRRGNYLDVLCQSRIDKSFGAFQINVWGPGTKPGMWIDHATGETGSNVVTFLMYCFNKPYETILAECGELIDGISPEDRYVPDIQYVDGYMGSGEKKPKATFLKPQTDTSFMKNLTQQERWDYHDAQGNLIAMEFRMAPTPGHPEHGKVTKIPKWQSRREDGRWWWSMPEGQYSLYNLYQLTRDTETPAMMHEGARKAAVAQCLFDHIQTSCMNGNFSPLRTDLSPLHGRGLVLWPDFDDAGVQWLRNVVRGLKEQDVEPAYIHVIWHARTDAGYDVVNHAGLQEVTEESLAWLASPEQEAFRQELIDAVEFQVLNVSAYARHVHTYHPPPPKKQLSAFPEPALPDAPTPTPAPSISEPQADPGSRYRSSVILPLAEYEGGRVEGQDEQAEVLKKTLAKSYRYDPEQRRWYRYDDDAGIWSKTSAGSVRKAAKPLVRKMHGGRLTATWLQNVINLFRDEVEVECWNPHSHLIPLQNGSFDLKTQKLLPHSPNHLHTYQLSFPYDPNSSFEASPIRGWLKDTFRGDSFLTEMARAFWAACIRGLSHVEKFLELVGEPGTGKSTFLWLTQQLVGPGQYAATELKQLEENRFEIGAVINAKLIQVSDSKQYRGTAHNLQALVSRDAMRVENKYIQHGCSDATYQGMIAVATNQPIAFDGDSVGVARRRITLPFARASQYRFRDLRREFQEHLPALFAWAVSMPEEEVVAVLQKQSQANQSLKRSILERLTETNTIAAWIRDTHLVFDPQAATNIGTAIQDPRTKAFHNASRWLYPNYCDYCLQTGSRAESLHVFSKKFENIFKHDLECRDIYHHRTDMGSQMFGVAFGYPGDTRPGLLHYAAGLLTDTDDSMTAQTPDTDGYDANDDLSVCRLILTPPSPETFTRVAQGESGSSKEIKNLEEKDHIHQEQQVSLSGNSHQPSEKEVISFSFDDLKPDVTPKLRKPEKKPEPTRDGGRSARAVIKSGEPLSMDKLIHHPHVKEKCLMLHMRTELAADERPAVMTLKEFLPADAIRQAGMGYFEELYSPENCHDDKLGKLIAYFYEKGVLVFKRSVRCSHEIGSAPGLRDGEQ